MKKAIAALLVIVLIFTISPLAYAADAVASPTKSRVFVNGAEVSFCAYNVKSNNYFKLRDIAYVLSGTPKQFEVSWDGSANTINLFSGEAYTEVGGEMSGTTSTKRSANLTSSRIFLDGEEINLTAYKIANNNYFKLRDLGKALDIFIGWDGSNVYIDSSKGYDYNEGINMEPNTFGTLEINAKLKKGMTDAEFNEAYEIAYGIARKYAGLSKPEQLEAIYTELRYLTDTVLNYSETAKHYNDVYGFFVLNTASCAGATRAVALCLTILGIPYEHVNENQWSHQWCRVKLGDTYWICDAYGMYVGVEPGPYEHPWF